jgi:hypothetical protein
MFGSLVKHLEALFKFLSFVFLTQFYTSLLILTSSLQVSLLAPLHAALLSLKNVSETYFYGFLFLYIPLFLSVCHRLILNWNQNIYNLLLDRFSWFSRAR